MITNSEKFDFPSLNWNEDEETTRPMPLHERPLQTRIDRSINLIADHHQRIALAIEQFWGHHDCEEYMQKLVMSGYKEGEHRMGFKPDVVSALLDLIAVHQTLYPGAA